jgi:hypothetical protein
MAGNNYGRMENTQQHSAITGICKDEAGTIAKGFPAQMLMELCKQQRHRPT